MRGFLLLLLIVAFALVPVSPAAAELPADAPSPEEHGARALEWLASAPPRALAASGEGMIEAGRFEFPQLFRPRARIESVGGGHIATISRRQHLVVLDARTGSFAASLDLGRQAVSLAVGRKGDRVLGIAPSRCSRSVPTPSPVLDLSRPFRPVEIASIDACGDGALVLPGGESGLVYGSERAALFDLESGAVRTDFGDDARSAAGAVVGDAVMLFLIHGHGGGTRPDRLRGWNVSNPLLPAMVLDRDVDAGSSLLADRRGEILLLNGPSGVSVLDPLTGFPLSTIGLPGGHREVALADAGGVRMLVVAWSDTVDLHDLENPASPVFAGTLPIPTLWQGSYRASPSVLPHPDRPWLAVAAVDPGGVEVVDLRDRSSLVSYRLEETRPDAIVWTELADGSPAVALSAHWSSVPSFSRPEGGITFTETIAVAAVEPPTPIARYSPVVPEEIVSAVPLGGRYVAVVDADANAVVLVDTADWTVAHWIGLGRRLHLTEGWVRLDSNGSTLAIGDHIEAEVYELRDGRLIRRPRIESAGPGAHLSDLSVLPDGTVLVLWSDRGLLQFFLPDGRVDSMPVPAHYGSIEVSPDGRRGVLSAGFPWVTPDALVVGVDLEARRTAWMRAHGAAFAHFVRGGKSVAATTFRMGRYGPLLLDSETGEPLGPQGDTAPAFLYLGAGRPFGAGDGERLPYWNWTWAAWASSVFDVSGDSARLVGISDEYVWDPIHLPRDDGRSGLEFRREGTRLISPEGEWTPHGPAPARQIRQLRHGFFSAVELPARDDPQTIVLLRDPGVNRPPEARAGDDRSQECASLSGTPVTLDGSGSRDPDSTPGTSDDLAAFAWTVDGAAIGSEPRIETSLSRGTHVASLEVRDVLDAVGSDEASIEIRDTLPPEVALSLRPFLRGGRLWAHEWTIEARAEDRCDGTVDARARLPLDPVVLAAPVAWVEASSEAIEIVSTPRGLAVRLIGPDRSRLETIWSTARNEGGLTPAAGAVRMELRDPPSRELLASYAFDAPGRVTSATVFGPEADLPVAASARDSSGWVGVAETSLRREIDRVCRELPANAACRWTTGTGTSPR